MLELRATSYTSSTSELKIVVTAAKACQSNITTIDNNTAARLVTCVDLPTLTTVLPVFITINGNDIPVFSRNGNTLMSDQIASKRSYTLKYGTTPTHFIVTQCLQTSQATAASTSVSASEVTT